jgi:two-component system NtrC family sensor kinase
MSAVGRMVSGVAHELNNPLTVIMGNTELAKRRLIAKGGDPKEIEFLDKLHQHGDRCRRIVANLLQFARQERPTLESTKLNQLVEQGLQLREYELQTRNVELVREFDTADPIVCADSNKIIQVVLNLLNNAHDAIREAARPGMILIRTAVKGNQVALEFLDNGTGLREPERVFDPFYTTKEIGQGTGLGLSVCYGIIEEHHGTIHAENWDQGARFIITLPLGEGCRAAAPEQAPVAVDTTGRKHHVLIVDDEAPLAELQVTFLTDLGVDASGVHSGEAAIAHIRRHQTDLVISDVRMPGKIDGIQLYEWIQRNRPELRHRFIFISGDMISMNAGEFFLKSTAKRIQKPFDWDEYSGLVQEVLSR